MKNFARAVCTLALAFACYVLPALAQVAPASLVSTYQLTPTTSFYSASQLIANNATPALITLPSFQIFGAANAVPVITRLRLSTNDTTSTGWGGQTIQVDLWSAAPTFTNGDRGAWLPKTGTAGHLGSFSCVMAGTGSVVYGDGTYAECTPAVGTFIAPELPVGAPIYWTMEAITGSGTTGAQKQFTLIAEVLL